MTSLEIFYDWRCIPEKHPPCVYALVDPRSPRAPRYIGASRSLRERLKSHCKPARYRTDGFREWMDALFADGVTPALIVVSLHEDYETARRAEWRMMLRWRRRGVALLSMPTMTIEEKYLGIQRWRVAS